MSTAPVALVTGGASGVGLEIARALGADGYAVAILGRSKGRLAQASDALRPDVRNLLALGADVLDEDAVSAAASRVERSFGPVDIAVHAAGACGAMGPTWECAADTWRADVETSVVGAFLLVRRLVPRMVERGNGRFVAVSSYAGVRPAPYMSGYAAGKAALVNLVESLDAELAATGVRAFVLTPGFVWTDMTAALKESPWFPEVAKRQDEVPAERIAALITRIARGEADALSGRFLHVLDDIDDLLARRDELEREDLYAPRLRRLQPRTET